VTLQRSGRPGGGGESRASGPRPIHRIGPAVLAHMRAQAGASSAGNSEAKRSSGAAGAKRSGAVEQRGSSRENYGNVFACTPGL